MNPDFDWEDFLYGESLSMFEAFGLFMGAAFLLFFLFGIFALVVTICGDLIVKIMNWKDGLRNERG